MNINVLIDSLMVYAQENLLLDDLDLIYARNRIIQKLGVTDYEEYEIHAEMVDGMQNPYQLLNQISSFAVTNSVITEDGRLELETEIMAFLMKRPSEIADMFNDLLEQGKYAKAFLWLNEYNLKSGYIKFHNILRHWEAKGTKGKIEVFVAKDSSDMNLATYPGCSKCPEIDGFGKYKTMRRVPIDLGGDEYFWQFEENPYISGLGYATSQNHAALKVDENYLNRLFDFVTLAPNYFISMEESSEHACFVGAVKQLPIHKAPEIRKLKSAEYPYIAITELDWYTNVLRLTCTNREKLIEFVLKLAQAFSASKEGNKIGISLRKTDKYTVEIFFDNDLLKISEKNSGLFFANPNLLAKMGIVVLPHTLDEEIKQMDLYLTKEAKFSEANLPENMVKHKGMIAKVLKEIGSTKISSVEAQIDIKEEINNICESALSDLRVFPKDDDANELLNSFLAGIGIK